jgi:hypothetical protein
MYAQWMIDSKTKTKTLSKGFTESLDCHKNTPQFPLEGSEKIYEMGLKALPNPTPLCYKMGVYY